MKKDEYLGSMGIYLFTKDVLRSVLAAASYADFGKEIIPYTIRSMDTYAYPFA